ncbi:hypothetical protein ZWY2020_054518 [Hordeum vulgare]|nr:hypothetical protein ZWY2020_054518 [Hordeum vulgare]
MDKLSAKCGVYSLLRADFTADLDHRFRDHDERLLQEIDKLIQANTTTLDGLLTARVDGVREELALELEAIRGDWQKEPLGRGEASASRLVGGGRDSAADSLGFDLDYRGKTHTAFSASV